MNDQVSTAPHDAQQPTWCQGCGVDFAQAQRSEAHEGRYCDVCILDMQHHDALTDELERHVSAWSERRRLTAPRLREHLDGVVDALAGKPEKRRTA